MMVFRQHPDAPQPVVAGLGVETKEIPMSVGQRFCRERTGTHIQGLSEALSVPQ